MKKLLALTLALLMLSLCACGGDPDPTDPAGETTTAPTETTAAPTTEPQENPRLGTYADGVYTNDFIGIRCELSEEWYVYSSEEMAQLNGLVLDTMTDEDLVEQLKNASVAHLFYAMKDEGLVTMNVALENLGLVNGVLLDEQSYVEISVEQLPAALESMGMTDVTAETTTVTFAGAEHAGITVHGTFSGVDFYEKLVCVKVDSYIAVITVASYYEDQTADLLAMYTAA